MHSSCCLLLLFLLAEVQSDTSIDRQTSRRDRINPGRTDSQEGSHKRQDDENVRPNRESDLPQGYNPDYDSEVNLKIVSPQSSRGQDHYNPRPETESSQRDYNPRGQNSQRDYNPIPEKRGDERNLNPDSVRRGSNNQRNYDINPVSRESREDDERGYDSVSRDENSNRDYNISPVPRHRNNQKDYDPNPDSRENNNQRNHGSSSVSREENRQRDYDPNPIPREEDYKRDYNSDSEIRGRNSQKDYVPNPVPKERNDNRNYDPNPVSEKRNDQRDYNPNPIPREENNRRDYNPNPVSREENRRDYNPNPIPREENNRRDYNPKPVPADDRPIAKENFRPDLGGFDEKRDDLGGFDKVRPDPDPMPKDDKCICVPYYQCQDGHIVRDGSGIIDARRRPPSQEELPLDEKLKPPTCGDFYVCCQLPETSTVKPYEHRCGSRNPSGINSRILSPGNKGEADFGEWPWQAAVLKVEGKVYIFQCGGVLIDERHILTVAHCVLPYKLYENYPLKVRLGEWDTHVTTEFLAHDDYNVIQISIHHDFKNSSLWNDIAILKLDRDVVYAPHVDSICLPEPSQTFAGQNCVVTGWGKDAYKGGTFANIMKEVALMVIDNYNCEELLRKTRLGRFFQLYDGFLCAGGEQGLDSCKGDGGGPLACYTKSGSYVLAGLVSWGIDCGHPSVPGVYVKVQKYVDWISKNTGKSESSYWPTG